MHNLSPCVCHPRELVNYIEEEYIDGTTCGRIPSPPLDFETFRSSTSVKEVCSTKRTRGPVITLTFPEC